MPTKSHICHKFSNTEQLILEEYTYKGKTTFNVSYLTMEGTDERGVQQWYANNSQDFDDFNEAKRIFNLRRDSERPFNPYQD